jgi:hypothetical protein
MRKVTCRVPKVETRQLTYTVNVPQQQTRTEICNVQVCVPYTEEVPCAVRIPVTTQVCDCDFLVAILAKSFGYRGTAENLGDFRYG